MDNEGAVVRTTLGENNDLVRKGRGVVVFQNYVLGVVVVLDEPLQFRRGLADEQIWEFWKEHRP
jgi:hypothetical protein